MVLAHSCISSEIPNYIPNKFYILPLAFKNYRKVSIFDSLKRQDDSIVSRQKMYEFMLSKKGNRFERKIPVVGTLFFFDKSTIYEL